MLASSNCSFANAESHPERVSSRSRKVWSIALSRLQRRRSSTVPDGDKLACWTVESDKFKKHAWEDYQFVFDFRPMRIDELDVCAASFAFLSCVTYRAVAGKLFEWLALKWLSFEENFECSMCRQWVAVLVENEKGAFERCSCPFEPSKVTKSTKLIGKKRLVDKLISKTFFSKLFFGIDLSSLCKTLNKFGRTSWSVWTSWNV